MQAEEKRGIQLGTAHVLFLDIVGYSKVAVKEQLSGIQEPNDIVRLSDQCEKAKAANGILKILNARSQSLRKDPKIGGEI